MTTLPFDLSREDAATLVKVLSDSMDALISDLNEEYHAGGMMNLGPQIKRLAYTHDLITRLQGHWSSFTLVDHSPAN